MLGSGSRTLGNVVPDNLPGTMANPSNATVGINGTGTLDGSVPSGSVSSDVGVNSGVQRRAALGWVAEGHTLVPRS